MAPAHRYSEWSARNLGSIKAGTLPPCRCGDSRDGEGCAQDHALEEKKLEPGTPEVEVELTFLSVALCHFR